MKAELLSGQSIEYAPEPIGEGGMKRVFMSRDKSSVVCFFKDKSAADPERQRRLEAIIGKYNPTSDQSNGDYWKRLFCWPTDVVVRPELGVVAPVYPSSYFFASGPWKGKEKESRWFTSRKLSKMLPDAERGTWLNYLQICICVARAVRRLHMAGLAHSDLSNKNVLVDPSCGSATIIDIDSLVVPGLFPPDVIGTPGYIAPEVMCTRELPLSDDRKKTPNALTDQYALAVLVYEYLLRRHPLRGPKVHSTASAEEDEYLSMGPKALFSENRQDTSNRPGNITVPYSVLGPYLAPLVERAFVEGLHLPEQRPQAIDWEKGLVWTSDLLMRCGNHSCAEKWFVFGSLPTRCPNCGWTFHGTIPIVNLYQEGRTGNFVPERLWWSTAPRRIVGWEGQSLMPWHVYDDCFPGERADRKRLGYFVRHNGAWYLVNEQIEAMRIVGEGRVPPGHSIELKDMQKIHLSAREHGRLAVIQMVCT